MSKQDPQYPLYDISAACLHAAWADAGLQVNSSSHRLTPPSHLLSCWFYCLWGCQRSQPHVLPDCNPANGSFPRAGPARSERKETQRLKHACLYDGSESKPALGVPAAPALCLSFTASLGVNPVCRIHLCNFMLCKRFCELPSLEVKETHDEINIWSKNLC